MLIRALGTAFGHAAAVSTWLMDGRLRAHAHTSENERPRGRDCSVGGIAAWEGLRAGGERCGETAEIHLPHVSESLQTNTESESVGVTISAASGGDLGV
eukprot:6352078-Prymnesium_polylepis.1